MRTYTFFRAGAWGYKDYAGRKPQKTENGYFIFYYRNPDDDEDFVKAKVDDAFVYTGENPNWMEARLNGT